MGVFVFCGICPFREIGDKNTFFAFCKGLEVLMDNRFTKKRIANMLAYDWIKMIAVVLGIVFVWILAFTIGAPRASEGQVFGVYYYVGNNSFAYKKAADELADELIYTEKIFSYDILDYTSRVITNDHYGELMMTSISVSEGDIMITVDSEAGLKNNDSEVRKMLDGYGDVFYDYDRLIVDAKAYCIGNGFVTENSDGSYLLNENKISDYFAMRMVKDPRYRDKNGERYNQGVKDEIERIKSVWNNAIILEDCLLNHPEIRFNYTRYSQSILASPDDYKDEEYHSFTEKTYGINLGKLVGGEVTVTSEYYVPLKEGEEVSSLTADGIIMLVYDFKEAQPDLQFETLTAVNYFIGRYSNFLTTDHIALIK